MPAGSVGADGEAVFRRRVLQPCPQVPGVAARHMDVVDGLDIQLVPVKTSGYPHHRRVHPLNPVQTRI